jgi:signal transduction histidine kinase
MAIHEDGVDAPVARALRPLRLAVPAASLALVVGIAELIVALPAPQTSDRPGADWAHDNVLIIATALLTALCAAVVVLLIVSARRLADARRISEQRTADLVERAGHAARAEERERHQRILHDRVLQMLEMLARGERRFDTGVRGQVAREAAWLRDLVETGRERPPGNLVAELEALGVGFAAQGLRVELNTAGLAAAGNPQDRLSPARVAALAGATREALANVVKHADTGVATVRATYLRALPDRRAPGFSVTVVDAGRGFEPEAVERGQGLRRSIIGRLTEAGGTVLIESAEGEGTSVELRMPAD